MKATLHTEVHCGSCGAVMQYHEVNKIRCMHNIKCENRGVEYFAPAIELQPVKQIKPEEAKQDGEKPQRGRPRAKD